MTRSLSSLMLLAGCGGELVLVQSDAAVSEDVVTVVTVTYETKSARATYVEYGVDGAFDLATPVEAEPSVEHTAVLVGLPPEADISYRVVSGGRVSEVGAARTGSLPEGVPTATLTGDPLDGYLVTSVNGPAANWVLMLDRHGEVVWYTADTRGLSLFRALARQDGEGIVFSSAIQGGGPAEGSMIVRVPWAGGAVEELPVPALAHDFVELADGTVVSLAYHEQDGIEGNSLLAVDAEGGTTELWTTWDCYDPATDLGDDPEQGWTHANALDVLDDGTYLVGLRNFGTITKVDPASRSCRWGFGGPNGTVALDGGRFIHQHGFEWTGQQMLVFDNDGAAGNESRVMIYDFDGSGQLAPLAAEIRADPPEYSFIMGDAHALEGGRTLVVWSVPNKIDVYGADGERLSRLEIDGNGPLGFVQLSTSPYAP